MVHAYPASRDEPVRTPPITPVHPGEPEWTPSPRGTGARRAQGGSGGSRPRCGSSTDPLNRRPFAAASAAVTDPTGPETTALTQPSRVALILRAPSVVPPEGLGVVMPPSPESRTGLNPDVRPAEEYDTRARCWVGAYVGSARAVGSGASADGYSTVPWSRRERGNDDARPRCRALVRDSGRRDAEIRWTA